MTQSEIAYLIMVTAAAGLFAVVLAWISSKAARR